MGAIAGIWGELSDEQIKTVLQNMMAPQIYRGKDENGTYRNKTIGIAAGIRHTFSTSRPVVFNEDRSVICVCDGEIYNWQELNKDLSARGHKSEPPMIPKSSSTCTRSTGLIILKNAMVSLRRPYGMQTGKGLY